MESRARRLTLTGGRESEEEVGTRLGHSLGGGRRRSRSFRLCRSIVAEGGEGGERRRLPFPSSDVGSVLHRSVLRSCC